MLPTVYTRRLLAGASLERVSAVVPAGAVWVVRDIAVANTGGALSVASVSVSGGWYVYWASIDPAGAGRYAHWSGSQVVNAGETLEAHSAPASCTFLITGYVFSS